MATNTWIELPVDGGGSGGTVTSVGLADGSTTPIFTVTGSPVTTNGTLTLALKPENANTVFSGPASGAAAQPTFRALTINDLPTTAGFSFFTSGTTYTTPANITTSTLFEIVLVGGGASGAGTTATASASGPGGGSGGTNNVFLTGLNPSTAYTMAIGVGGTGVSASVGNPGTNTSITINATTYTANGGSVAAGTNINTAGGAGGTTVNATIAVTGQNGGGNQGTFSAASLPGLGGSTPWGQGGNATPGSVGTGNNGLAATGFGAGGGGGRSSSTATATVGGNGAPGMILIRWKN